MNITALKKDLTTQFSTYWLAYFSALIVLLITLFLWHLISIQSKTHIQDILTLQTDHINGDVIYRIQNQVATAERFALYSQLHPDQKNEAFFIKTHPEVRAIARVDHQLKIINSAEKDPQLLMQIQQFIQTNAQKMQKKTRSWIIAPVNNGNVFLITPIKFTEPGYVITLVDIKYILEKIPFGNTYAVKITDDNHIIYDNPLPSTDVDNQFMFSATLTFGNIHWQTELQPAKHLVESLETPLPWIVMLLGFALAIILGRAIYFAQLSMQRAEKLITANENLRHEMDERSRSEAAKQKLEKALLQGQKLQAIGTLAGGIAHDFNNIIYAIRGYTEMARDDIDKKTITFENLGKVLVASQRAQELVSRILVFSRRQHHEAIALSLKETIEGVLDLLRPTIPAGVMINFATQITDCKILGNQTQLHQVVVNIINNAVDAMEGEGTITLELSRTTADDSAVKPIGASLQKNYCVIAITDTGHGMDLQTLNRIFEPFFTTKEVGKGTGLGLSTALAITKEFGGDITVTSQLGRGTTFNIWLPELINEPEEVYGKDPARGR